MKRMWMYLGSAGLVECIAILIGSILLIPIILVVFVISFVVKSSLDFLKFMFPTAFRTMSKRIW